MGTMVAGAPLLAGGPPGWVAYGLLGLATLAGGVLIYESTHPQATAEREAETARSDTGCKTCDRPYVVRIHAQDMIVGGTTGATLGAPPVVKPDIPVTVAEGVALSNATFALLTRSQARELEPAKRRLERWIERLPASGGFLGKHSAYPAGRPGPGGNRYDVDSMGCTNNFVS